MSTFSDIALKMSRNDAVASPYRELYFQDFARQTIIVPRANKQKKGTCTIVVFFHFMIHTIAPGEKGFQLTRTIVKAVICKQTGWNLIWFTTLLGLACHSLTTEQAGVARYFCTDSLSTFDFIPQQFL